MQHSDVILDHERQVENANLKQAACVSLLSDCKKLLEDVSGKRFVEALCLPFSYKAMEKKKVMMKDIKTMVGILKAFKFDGAKGLVLKGSKGDMWKWFFRIVGIRIPEDPFAKMFKE